MVARRYLCESIAIRARNKDKEEIELVEKLVTRTRNPDTLKYIEKKLEDKGIQRRERHPIESGHGGKFTWEDPDDEAENELDPAPPAIDPRDPNYVDEDFEEKVKEEVDGVVVGEVEVAKVAETKEGVARIEVRPPLAPA